MTHLLCKLSSNHLPSLEAVLVSIEPEQHGLSQSAGSFAVYVTT